MTIAMVLRTVFEILLFIAVVWGIFHEDKMAAFERKLFAGIRRKRLRVVKTASHKTISC